MPKSDDAKKRMLYIAQYLMTESDDSHVISTKQILKMLGDRNIKATQHTVLDDIHVLSEFIDINTVGGRYGGFYVCSREFEPAELQILVGSIQSSKFISEKKSLALIKKIKTLCSTHEANTLQKSIFISDRTKASDESIFIKVNAISEAILAGKSIKFQYCEYNLKKELIPRHGGNCYSVSPYFLIWNDENYYLICYDNKAKMKKTFRVDKLINIKQLRSKRCGADIMKNENPVNYNKRVFGMFTKDPVNVKMRFGKGLIGAAIDVLGRDIYITPDDDKHVIITAEVEPSSHFYGWVLALGGAEIIWPRSVVDEMKSVLEKQLEKYL